MAEGHREAAPRVLDGREHGGSLAAEGRRPITRHIAVYPRKLTAANTSPMTCIVPPQQGQTLLSGSTTTS